MKTVKIKVFQFDELGETAKEQARAWYREGIYHDEWWESTYEDAANIGLRITGFGLDRDRHADGEFNCLGQGAQCAAAILANHGKDCETFKTATAFLADLAKLNAEIEAVDGDDETNADYETFQDKRGLLDEEFLASILEDYSIMLQHEMEYLNSDEQVDESILANEYEFTEDGKRFVVKRSKLSPGAVVVAG